MLNIQHGPELGFAVKFTDSLLATIPLAWRIQHDGGDVNNVIAIVSSLVLVF